ncbi:MAG: His/Gly/Thr/Pro-type tRNA ligase C-terminal domain-containing protein, partial [Pseudomonadota bacterium]
AEVFLGNPKQFGKQLAYADKRRSPVAIIQGSDEREAGTVQVKDLILGAEEAQAITDNREWRESRAAQVTVPRNDLVKTVREMLSRHGLA